MASEFSIAVIKNQAIILDIASRGKQPNYCLTAKRHRSILDELKNLAVSKSNLF